MGSKNADISRDMYNELLEYLVAVFQQGPNKPLVDADVNDIVLSLHQQVKRALELFGDGSPDALAFLIQESSISNINNFKIAGGDGTLTPDGAGRIFVNGLLARLWPTSIEWDSIGTDVEAIHDRSTGLIATKLTNSGANWNVNEYAGRTLYPNTQSGTGFTIASNTQTEILISAGDLTTVAAIGDTYRVDPFTPVAPRTDIVYADIYLDEIDDSEDSNLLHPLSGGSSFVSAVRMKLKHILHIRENSTTVPTGPFLDSDGHTHYYLKIATLTRDANNTITTAEITDEVIRDIFNLPAIRSEIIAARGSAASLDARLDQSLKEDGDILDNKIADVHVSPTADINQSKIANSDTYDDTFVGTPGDLEDDLNRLRNEVKETKGSASWETAPARDLVVVDADLAAIETELLNARGAFPAGELDDRLDVSINEDGTLKPLALQVPLSKLAAEPSMVFMPHDTNPFTTYRLHQFRGFFRKTVGGADLGPYFDYGLGHTDYPMDAQFGLGAGPGGEDNDPLHGIADAWFPVYLIGRIVAGVVRLALVYGTMNRNPWTQGPLLDDSVYAFATNSWLYWKLIAIVRNQSGVAWEIVTVRKKGNHCEYELAQRAFTHGVFGDSSWQIASIAPRVPPTSLRAFVRAWVEGKDATQTLMLRPPAVQALIDMHLHDIPLAGLALENKIQADSFPITAGLSYWGKAFGPVDLNENQDIGYRHIAGGTEHNAYIDVLGYEEFTDFLATDPNWP